VIFAQKFSLDCQAIDKAHSKLSRRYDALL